MSMKSLQDLFLHEIKDLYSAEKQLIDAIPKMAEAASNSHLKEAFDSHLKETELQLERVQQLLHDFDTNPGSTKCDAMEGLILEGKDVINSEAPASVKDAALIAAAQRVEHYEMAGYGTARAFAESLGHTAAANVLSEILEEESAANEKLNSLALNEINPAAMAVG